MIQCWALVISKSQKLYFLIAIYRKMTKVWQISKLTIPVTNNELQPHVVAWLDLKTILVSGVVVVGRWETNCRRLCMI